jgi:hypothetical protein
MSDTKPELVIRTAVFDWLDRNRSILGKVLEAAADELVPILADQLKDEIYTAVPTTDERILIARLNRACVYALYSLDQRPRIGYPSLEELRPVALQELEQVIEDSRIYLSITTSSDKNAIGGAAGEHVEAAEQPGQEGGDA